MKTILMMVMTVNGFIARLNDEVPWSPEEFKRCAEFAREAGNIIVGRKTYQIMKETDDIDDEILTIVISRDVLEPHGNTVYVTSPTHALAYAKDKGFATANIGGGTALVTDLLTRGLIDEIVLDIEPILFDRGLPLAQVSIPDIHLEHLSTQQFGDTVRLRYEVKK
ncbi:MAG: dihydrofolate reductase [Parcubacteria group bacterium]|nr:dihydrofolate reductase [Parcubacteria group bacterium]